MITEPAHADHRAGAGEMLNDPATAVSVFHRAGEPADFVRWLDSVEAVARTAPGYLESRLSEFAGTDLDWAAAVTFDDPSSLHAWLDSPERGRLLTQGEALGFRRKNADLIIDSDPPPTGVGVFQHSVAPGMQDDFVATQVRLIGLSSSFSGFEGATLIRPADGSRLWFSLLRFRTDRQLESWLDSAARRDALPQLRSELTRDFTVLSRRTAFGSVLRVDEGTTTVTPQWKTAMLVLLVLYPTVMTLSRFLGPVLDDLGAQPWLSMWLSQIVSVGVMTWLLMPLVTGWFRRWLDPVDGAGTRLSLFGAAVVVGVYAVTLSVFASVTWLQFWDYQD